LKNLVMLAALAGVVGFAVPTTPAEAAHRQICKIEKRTVWSRHGYKRVKYVRVCRTLRHHHH
jgi:hypothetical protein